MAKNDWKAGTPCWVDLSVPDLDRSAQFYSTVLGWTYEESSAEFGGYTNARADGQRAAALVPQQPGQPAGPSAWTVYLASDDIAETATKVTAAGGQSLFPPMEVGDFGSMALWLDPNGSTFGGWQAGQHGGFEATDIPGSVAWCDLMAPDSARAKDFFGTVFGLTFEAYSEDGVDYALFTVPGGERPAGGIGGHNADALYPPGWSVAFAVASVDDSVGVVSEAGGTVLTQPSNFEFGRMAMVSGPSGELFTLFNS